MEARTGLARRAWRRSGCSLRSHFAEAETFGTQSDYMRVSTGEKPFSIPFRTAVKCWGHLSSALLHGPRWLTGGSVGPEGSVFSFVTMGLQFLVVMWLFPKRVTQKSGGITSPDN